MPRRRLMTRDFTAELETIIGGLGNALPKDVTIDCKRFFNGAAAYVDGRIFMSLTPAGLAVKLAGSDKEALMKMGGTPLRYFRKRRSRRPMWLCLKIWPPAWTYSNHGWRVRWRTC